MQNIEHIPGTNSLVSINNITPEINSEFYIDNEIETSEGNPKAIYNDLGWKAKVKAD